MKNTLLKQVFLRNKSKCFYCGDEITFGNFTIDHTISIKHGGGSGIDNLQVVCKSCNSSKSTKSHDDYVKYIRPYIDGSVERKDLKEFWLFKRLEKRFSSISKKYE